MVWLGDWIWQHWRDVISVLGLFVSILGFGYTLRQVHQTLAAARAAERAVKRVQRDLRRADTVGEMSTTIALLDEMKTLQRSQKWDLLLDRYSSLRRRLVAVKTANSDLSAEHQTALQGLIMHLRGLEDQVERHFSSGSSPPNIPGANKVLSREIDKVVQVLEETRSKIGSPEVGNGPETPH